MKKIIKSFESLPKWYAVGIILLYSISLAEFFSEINHLALTDNSINSIYSVISRIGYVLIILSSFVVWIIMTLLFHLVALLFNGNAIFYKFLITSSYLYIIPTVSAIIGIFILDNTQLSNTKNTMTELMQNDSLKLAMDLINYSFVPYYILIAVLIHHVYRIKYVYAVLSVVIPIASVWGISELFKLI